MSPSPIQSDADGFVYLQDENMKMTDCYFEKKDWRKCKDEVCFYNNSSLPFKITT